MLLPSSLVTPFSPLWGSSRRPFPNPTHSHTHTHRCPWLQPLLFMATTRWLSIHALSDSENSRLPLPPTLSPERSAAFIIASKSEFFSMTRRQVVALPRRADQNCMKPCGGTTPPEASSTLSHFATSLSKSGIPSFSTAARCCLSLFFFPFYGIPDVSFCHSSFVSSPPTSWPQSDSCKPQPARENMHAPCRRGCQPDKALRIIKANNCFQGPSRSRRLSSAASGFFMKTPFNNV